jgi:hypothetical protein
MPCTAHMANITDQHTIFLLKDFLLAAQFAEYQLNAEVLKRKLAEVRGTGACVMITLEFFTCKFNLLHTCEVPVSTCLPIAMPIMRSCPIVWHLHARDMRWNACLPASWL